MFLEIFYLQVTPKIIPPLQICVFTFPLTRKIHLKGSILWYYLLSRLTDKLCQAVVITHYS